MNAMNEPIIRAEVVEFTLDGKKITALADQTLIEIAGQNGKFSPATARLEGGTVVLSAADTPAPVSVRYGWADNPECNLYNAAGLPASPFHSRQ